MDWLRHHSPLLTGQTPYVVSPTWTQSKSPISSDRFGLFSVIRQNESRISPRSFSGNCSPCRSIISEKNSRRIAPSNQPELTCLTIRPSKDRTTPAQPGVRCIQKSSTSMTITIKRGKIASSYGRLCLFLFPGITDFTDLLFCLRIHPGSSPGITDITPAQIFVCQDHSPGIQ